MVKDSIIRFLPKSLSSVSGGEVFHVLGVLVGLHLKYVQKREHSGQLFSHFIEMYGTLLLHSGTELSFHGCTMTRHRAHVSRILQNPLPNS